MNLKARLAKLEQRHQNKPQDTQQAVIAVLRSMLANCKDDHRHAVIQAVLGGVSA